MKNDATAKRAGLLSRPAFWCAVGALLALAVVIVLGWGVWILRIVLALVVFFAIVLLAPVIIGVRLQQGQFVLWVRLFGIRLQVYPLPAWLQKLLAQKPEEEKTEEPEEEEEQKEPEEAKPKEDFHKRVARLKRLVAAGKAALYVFLRHLRIRNVRLVLPVHSEDAADTALACGRLQAAIGTLRATLDGRLHVQYKQIELIPDFAGQHKDALFFTCKVCFVPGIIIPMAWAFLRRWLQKRPYSKKAYRQALAKKRAAAAQKQQDGGRASAA